MSSFGNKHVTFFRFCAWLKIPSLPHALETFAYSYHDFRFKFFTRDPDIIPGQSRAREKKNKLLTSHPAILSFVYLIHHVVEGVTRPFSGAASAFSGVACMAL
jgi:hypothetical protein